MSESLGTDARALIDQAASGDDPSIADRERMRARLALALVATTGGFAVAGAAKAAAGVGGAASAGGVGAVGTVGTVASVGLGMKIVLGAVVVATLAGAGGLAVAHRRAPAAAAAPTASAAFAAAAAATATAGTAAAPAGVVAPSTPVVLAASPTTELEPPSPSLAAAAAPAPHASASTPDVAEELVLLREARSALKAGDPDRSLHLLAEHARRFPRGALTEEREAGRAVASCARVDSGGSVDEARAAVARFLRAYPRSLHASRVHSACDALDAR